MNIPTNLFMWIMAFLPIIVLLVLMIKFQWGATEAAPIGLLITIITGIVFYKADMKLIAAESAKGIWSALIILIIVWTAILMYQVGEEAKAFVVIKNGMRKLLPNELLLVIAMGWIFESFLQGITGFGVPVAVGAPLLIGIGVKPMWAVILPLLGQAWGNTFGTLAAAWDSLAMSACSRKQRILSNCSLDSCIYLVLECNYRICNLLVLRKRKSVEKRIFGSCNYVLDSRWRRTPFNTGKHNTFLFPSIMRILSCIVITW